MNAPAGPVPPDAPASRVVGVMETDTFCEKCGFNLHTQKVWRDERLDILVCRCPECGAHQAATNRLTATTPWLNRLAVVGLLIWVALGMMFVVAVFFGLIGVQAAASEGLLQTSYETADGRPVDFGGYINGKQQWVTEDERTPVDVDTQIVQRRRLAPWLLWQPPRSQTDRWRFATPMQTLLIGGIFTLIALVATTIMSAASWFWRPGRRWLWLLLPILSSAVVWAVIRVEEPYQMMVGTTVVQRSTNVEQLLVGAVLVLQLIVMSFGLAVGRTLARTLLAVFVPPQARQFFSFLWHCDGKTMPPLKPAR